MIDSEIQNYAQSQTSGESELLEEIRLQTISTRDDKNMLSGFYQGRLLSTFSKMLQPKVILEIGTYMGYSALCLAEGLSNSGKIITLDSEPETFAISSKYFVKSDYAMQIDARLGNALEIIPTLKESLDLVFIDADKPNYANYFDLVFPKMKVGGIIIADNVLWGGQVLDVEKFDDESTIALKQFNEKILADERVSNVLLAVRDGLMIIRKERDFDETETTWKN
jgi:caffeoyl-CoA O-methyltransferase